MLPLIFPAPATPVVPVANAEQGYPVSRIFCVGKNFAAHAREMGGDPKTEPPFYFSKPANAITLSGATIPYPPGTENFHYELELVIAIGAPAYRVAVADAEQAVWGYACGLDMTRRDLQAAAKSKGLPWDLSKGFENSAVISPLRAKADVANVAEAAMTLTVNGNLKQNSHVREMTWNVAEIISNLSHFYHLQPGDLIYTGTPEGVGPVVAGDRLHGQIEGVGDVTLTISARDY